MDRRARIIELNDRLRATFNGGRVQMARDVYDLDERLWGRALWVMAHHRNFDNEGEHDWGVFLFAGYAFEWQIEYRSNDGSGISSDPADPNQTLRVLTLSAIEDVLGRPRHA